MKPLAKFAAGLLAATVMATAAYAAPLATTVTALTPYEGDLAFVTDGVIPDFGQYYREGSVWTDFDSPTPLTLNFDFGGVYTITDFLAGLDNNDDYTIQLFNGADLIETAIVGASLGNSGGGFDIFATFTPVPNSGTQITGFTPVLATSAIVTGTGGDGAFGIGEVQFFGSAATGVVEPASWAMLIAGFGLTGAMMRRRPAVRFVAA